MAACGLPLTASTLGGLAVADELLTRIWCALQAILCAIQNSGVFVINLIMRPIVATLNALLNRLPTAEMPEIPTETTWLSTANYFFPIVECSLLIGAIFTAWIAWKALAFFLRFWLPI